MSDARVTGIGGEFAGVAGLALLIVNGALLGGIGLAFTPLHSGPVPVPMGALLSILILPWLVHRAADIDPRGAIAGAPLTAWLLVVTVLGLTGPGGDVLLPVTWQSLLLFAGGLGSGLLAVRRVLNTDDQRRLRQPGGGITKR